MARIIRGSKPDYIENLKPIHRLMAMKTACSGYRSRPAFRGLRLQPAPGHSHHQFRPLSWIRVRPDENGRRRASGRDDKR